MNQNKDQNQQSNLQKKVIGFFGINQSMVGMLIMVIFLGMGEKMGERFLPVYMLAIGGSAYSVGLLNALDNFLSAIYAFIGGHISDRLGYKRALMTYTWVSLLGYGIIILFPVWQAVLIGAIFFISWTALSLPAILSMVAKTVKKEKQVMGVSLHSLIKRIPMALGPVLGAVFIEIYGIVNGARIAFAMAFVLGLLALVFISKFIEDREHEKEPAIPLIQTVKRMSKPLKTLLISDIFIRFAEQLPYAFVVVWVMENNHFSAADFSMLTVIEMIVAMLIYIPVAFLTEKTSSKLTVSITFVFFTLFPVTLLVSKTMPMLILAFIIRGMKEFGEPTRKALIVKLSPAGAQGATFGTYYLIRDIIVAAVSLGSAWLWLISPAANLVTATLMGVIGTLIFILFGKDDNTVKEV